MNRRDSLRVVVAATCGLLIEKPAHASVARALRLEELTQRSRHVLVGEPLDAYSAWTRIGARKHIVTYTRIRTHEVLAGRDPQDSEVLVRTLGGRVGELGELVHGEALLQLGERSVLFVMPSRDTLTVTGMAQGHYPLFKDVRGAERLLRSREARELVNEAGAAVQRLPGLQLPEARKLLQGLAAQ
jgi:hypothetical protein